MYCSKCGKEIPNNSQFCQHCGNRLEIDIQQENQEIEIKQGKVIIHSYTGFYIVNPPVKIYIGDTLITKLDKGKTFEYTITQTITLTIKCGIRSTEVTVSPNAITDIYLNFDKNTGILIPTCNERTVNSTRDNILTNTEAIDTDNRVNTKETLNNTNNQNKTAKPKNSPLAIIIFIIVVISASLFVWNNIENNRTISYSVKTSQGTKTIELNTAKLNEFVTSIQKRNLKVGKYFAVTFRNEEILDIYAIAWYDSSNINNDVIIYVLNLKTGTALQATKYKFTMALSIEEIASYIARDKSIDGTQEAGVLYYDR